MTAMSEELFLALIAIMGAQLSLIGAHSNTVAVAGSEVIMKCQSNSGNCRGVEWKKRNAPQAPEPRIFRNNEIYPDFRGRYSVDNSSGCNLLIKNASLTDAGRFNCEDTKGSSTVNELSLLIVLESLPKCSLQVNASSDGIAVEGDGIQFTCEMKLNATEGEASLTWKNLDNVSASVKPGTTAIILHSVVAKRPKIPSFECITKFNLPRNIDGLASNIPTVPSCMAEPNMTLLYQVKTVTLTPSLSDYSLGSTITCSADGNPSPSYKWQIADANGMNETWTDIGAGKAFERSMTDRYNGTIFRCVANNTIRDKSFVAHSHTFQVNDKSAGNSGSFSATTGGTSEENGVPMLIIASAAAAGVVALLIVIVIICICRVRSNEKNKSGNDKSSNGDQIPLNINGSINPQMTTVPVASIQPQPRSEAGKRPQIPTPEPKKPIPAPEPKKQIPAPGPKKHKDDAKKKRPDPPPQKEEVLYADLAMEQGPTRRLEQQAPAYDPHAVYADVQLA